MIKKKKKKKPSRRVSRKDLRREILSIFKRNPNKALQIKQVSRKLSVKKNTEKIRPIIEELASEGKIFRVADFTYKYSTFANTKS